MVSLFSLTAGFLVYGQVRLTNGSPLLTQTMAFTYGEKPALFESTLPLFKMWPPPSPSPSPTPHYLAPLCVCLYCTTDNTPTPPAPSFIFCVPCSGREKRAIILACPETVATTYQSKVRLSHWPQFNQSIKSFCDKTRIYRSTRDAN